MSASQGFLDEPVVTFDRMDDREDGPVVSAYVELRRGIQAVRTVQPNPNALVYFLLGEDGRPVGISVHEPASGLAVCEIVTRLIEGANGREGVDRTARHRFFTGDEIRAVLRGMQKSLEGLVTA